MNTERTPYSAEDDDSDDSTAVSFNSGPAFRPIPRIERSAPPPAPKPPESPRIPKVIFDRSLEAIRAEEAKRVAEEDDDDAAEDTSVTPRAAASATASRAKPAAPKSPPEALGIPMTAPAPEVVDAEAARSLLQHEAQADSHLPDLGEFTATLPENPPAPDAHPSQSAAERAPAEQHPALPATENEPLTRTYPAETAADLPEWPEETPDSADPPLPPTPPRQRPAAAQYGQFEAPPSSVVNANESIYATAANTTGFGSTAGGGGGGRPPLPPSGASGGMPPGNQPPNNHNAYFGMSGYNANAVGGGSGSGGYNPNAQPNYEVVQPVQQKKGNIWPYVAVLAENIARKRADRKLKKEMGARMDQQERTQEASNANQLRLERQQQQVLDEQRQQAIREAHRPSGSEWGVPRPVSAAGTTIPGQRPGERAPMPGVMGQPEQSTPMPMQPSEQYMEQQPAELAGQPAGRERHSAWHTYYEGEDGQQIEYGKGFKQEQKEIVRDHTGDSVVAGVAGAAGVAGTTGRPGRSGGGSGGPPGPAGPSGGYGYGQASGQGYQPQQHQPTLPGGMTTPGLPQNTSRTDPQHRLSEHTKKSNVPGPLFWLMIGLIIFAFFAAAFI